jgi:predicted MPP superfamily phosphohydrolase
VPASDATEHHQTRLPARGTLPCADGQVGASPTALPRAHGFQRVRLRLHPLPACLLFCTGDWALLSALPLLKLSFSAEIWFPDRQPYPRLLPALYLLTQLSLTLVQAYAYVVEPLWVETTELSLRSAELDPSAPTVRIVLLGDLHIERSSYREAYVVRQVNALGPDLIVLSGDYLNLSRLADPVSAEHFRQFVGQLHAPYGIYAVRGSVEPSPAFMEQLVNDTPVVWLEQEAAMLDVRGQRIALVGVACSHIRSLDAARFAQAANSAPQDAFTVLLYHSPDLIAEASTRQVDLYLAGHTHGGQIRLPFYGAVVTGSVYGKRYEAGLFHRKGTTMYVTRGLGFEGGPMPRARFLSRPEVVSLDLGGQP